MRKFGFSRSAGVADGRAVVEVVGSTSSVTKAVTTTSESCKVSSLPEEDITVCAATNRGTAIALSSVRAAKALEYIILALGRECKGDATNECAVRVRKVVSLKE